MTQRQIQQRIIVRHGLKRNGAIGLLHLDKRAREARQRPVQAQLRLEVGQKRPVFPVVRFLQGNGLFSRNRLVTR